MTDWYTNLNEDLEVHIQRKLSGKNISDVIMPDWPGTYLHSNGPLHLSFTDPYNDNLEFAFYDIKVFKAQGIFYKGVREFT